MIRKLSHKVHSCNYRKTVPKQIVKIPQLGQMLEITCSYFHFICIGTQLKLTLLLRVTPFKGRLRWPRLLTPVSPLWKQQGRQRRQRRRCLLKQKRKIKVSWMQSPSDGNLYVVWYEYKYVQISSKRRPFRPFTYKYALVCTKCLNIKFIFMTSPY